MTKKTNYEFDRAMNRVVNPSPFDKFVREVEAKEIPTKYIEQIIVFYADGTTVELSGDEITHPIPVNRNATWEAMESTFKRMKDVKVFINTDRLETDVNILVEDYLGKHC